MSLLLAIGLAGMLSFQATTGTQNAAVFGQVLEEGTRAPIAGAQVTLFPARPPRSFAPFSNELRTVLTDQNGRYEFEDVEPGRYRINIQKAGLPVPFGPTVPEVDLKAGERRDAGTVTLQKGGVIVGRVLDEAGDPLVNARVLAMRRPPVPPRAASPRPDFLIPAGPGAETNDVGEFRLFGLAPGEYYVQAVTHSGFIAATLPAQGRTMLPTYFPGTSDAAAAQPITVASGQSAGEIVIRMVGAAAFRVSGAIKDEAGRPVVNALVKLIDADQQRPRNFMGPMLQARTDATGRFTINNVTNGGYTLLAIAPVLIARNESPGSGSSGVFGSFSGSGTVGGQVMTETRDGTTIQYRDDQATRVAVAVNDANVENLEVTVRSPGR